MRKDVGIFGRRQRRWAWVGFLLLAMNAPVVALLVPGVSWMLSVTVAGLVAFVIIVDDRRQARQGRA